MAPSVLMVRFSSIGDLLLTTPLIRAIRTRHPDARIAFVVRADMAATLRTNPRIDELIPWQRGSSLAALGRRLRAGKWTHRLDLHGSLRSRLLRQLVGGKWTGYPKHRGRRRLLITTHGAHGGALGPVAERYFAAARDLDVSPDSGGLEYFVTEEAAARADGFLAGRLPRGGRPIVALAPGAAHFTKRWPLRHWAALARALVAQCHVVVTGGDGDRDAAAAIVGAAGPGAISAAGAFDLEGTAALIRQSRLLVAGDTGVLHLATAVGVPVVGLYGPTVEAFGFFPYHARSVAVQHALSCRPCSSQGGPACPLGHHDCLEKMIPDEVLAAIRTVAAP